MDDHLRDLEHTLLGNPPDPQLEKWFVVELARSGSDSDKYIGDKVNSLYLLAKRLLLAEISLVEIPDTEWVKALSYDLASRGHPPLMKPGIKLTYKFSRRSEIMLLPTGLLQVKRGLDDLPMWKTEEQEPLGVQEQDQTVFGEHGIYLAFYSKAMEKIRDLKS